MCILRRTSLIVIPLPCIGVFIRITSLIVIPLPCIGVFIRITRLIVIPLPCIETFAYASVVQSRHHSERGATDLTVVFICGK